MFKNLRAEMAREGVDGKSIAAGIGISNKAFSNKILGKTEFTRTEMLNIHRKYFPKCSIEYLFNMSDSKTA
ncbi:XRE family transcriptional regulator [Paenibacillus ginsengarvi]|uniref:XRE family transcriptional regulator n=1 Tax=Paenibacillus ginsengarvi TaxID=400777 RepID=UPI0011C48861|nr:XRE family transcriptional regulator [Paenibacillus ginsengarvi]